MKPAEALEIVRRHRCLTTMTQIVKGCPTCDAARVLAAAVELAVAAERRDRNACGPNLRDEHHALARFRAATEAPGAGREEG